jgi:hypothetical protein
MGSGSTADIGKYPDFDFCRFWILHKWGGNNNNYYYYYYIYIH